MMGVTLLKEEHVDAFGQTDVPVILSTSLSALPWSESPEVSEFRGPLVWSPHTWLIGLSRPLFQLSRHRNRLAATWAHTQERSDSHHLNDCSSPARHRDREIASHEKDRKIRSGVTRLQHCANILPVFLSRYRGK